ncbi:hypothetical protein [Streptomyces atratus]|uniref:hypothetical protein n=1 Tax=Streptomyces atratus TaxID=1893 RepID=UPI00324BDB24
MSDREQLLHLVDRARRGSILPAEIDALAVGITELAQALDDAAGELAELREHNDRTCEAAARAEQAEAALARAQALAARWAVLRAYGGAATELRAALDEQPTTTAQHADG